MREFIGHVLKVIADNFPSPVEGVMVDDKPNMILLKGKDGKITRIVKSHISGFIPMDFEPFEFIPFHVMFCENEQARCPGVQYVKEGAGVAASEYEQFMAPCPCRVKACKFGTKGEIRSASSVFLRKMIGGTMYGEYPAKAKKEAANGNGGEGAGEAGGEG
jgi:hypothetical protein